MQASGHQFRRPSRVANLVIYISAQGHIVQPKGRAAHLAPLPVTLFGQRTLLALAPAVAGQLPADNGCPTAQLAPYGA